MVFLVLVSKSVWMDHRLHGRPFIITKIPEDIAEHIISRVGRHDIHLTATMRVSPFSNRLLITLVCVPYQLVGQHALCDRFSSRFSGGFTHRNGVSGDTVTGVGKKVTADTTTCHQ